MAIEPAATSANPAVTTMWDEATAPDSPAASANGTVRPSDIPMTTSRTVSPAVKCRSTCGVCGIAGRPCLSSDVVLNIVGGSSLHDSPATFSTIGLEGQKGPDREKNNQHRAYGGGALLVLLSKRWVEHPEQTTHNGKPAREGYQHGP